jgi:pimeloyl-ACP methyl ester carboxylesterase
MKKLLFILCLPLFLNACVTFNHRNPYPNIATLQFGNSKVHEFRSLASDTLIINIEGSGWTSVLGSRGRHRWNFVGFGSQLVQMFDNRYTILIPEKWDWNPETDYWWDFNARINYTEADLLECYLEGITMYLAERNFSSIILVGSSEGALFLPIIYEHLKEKYNITAMVSLGFGGLSIYESYSILKDSPIAPAFNRQFFRYFYEMYNTNQPKSYLTDLWRLSFMDTRPVDYFANINIPVLFIHGDRDVNVPVESTRYVQENLSDKPFEYIYYSNMPHAPLNYFQAMRLRRDIEEWFARNNL